MFIHNLNPVFLRIPEINLGFFSLGPLAIRYYGLVYAIGFVLITIILEKNAHKVKNLSKQKASDLMFYVMLGMLIGARIAHILFDLPYYIQNPQYLFSFWRGGMAFIGGLIGSFAVAMIYCRKHKISVYKVADLVVVYIPLVLGFGRIANFINGELFGYETSLPWGVNFNSEMDASGALVFRHPSQLYESILKFTLFGMMLYMKGKKLKDGQLFWFFVAFYGITRFTAEFFRYNGSLILGLSIMQYISLAMIVAGAVQFRRLR